MTSCTLTVASVVILLTTCLGQSGAAQNPWVELTQIDNVLRAGHVSGSLVYSSCGFHQRVPDALPPMRVLSDYSGPPKEVLEKMFADDPRMRVTQERGGMIRMVETDVPTNLLDFRIHHLTFFSSTDTVSNQFSHGPRAALIAVLANPEVRAFRKAHNLGPNPDAFPAPGDAGSGKYIVYGKLDEVTVSEALDHVLKTFPGFWLYENCVSKEGERTVYFNFVDVSP
jgi:hypothetical protein